MPATKSKPRPQDFGCPAGGWRRRAYIIIFESDTVAGRRFDQALFVAIGASVAVVIADSVQSIASRHGSTFAILEWLFTILFTIEYAVRLACVRQPLRYATSFFGIVDLLSILPTYLAFAFPEAQALVDVRVFRLLRIFRVLKLTAYFWEYQALGASLVASRRRILVFLLAVAMIVLIMGTLMYVVEGPQHGFTSIPLGVYWAITTMTTVGFGDLTPKTDLGRLIASFMMLVGWGTLAVPTGIVTSELTARRIRGENPTKTCPSCEAEGLGAADRYCAHCGTDLTPEAR